jgi:hypothetical protein
LLHVLYTTPTPSFMNIPQMVQSLTMVHWQADGRGLQTYRSFLL